jgi:hypothetical protein
MSKPFKLKYKGSAFPFYSEEETILDLDKTESNALVEAALSQYQSQPKYQGLTKIDFLQGMSLAEYKTRTQANIEKRNKKKRENSTEEKSNYNKKKAKKESNKLEPGQEDIPQDWSNPNVI